MKSSEYPSVFIIILNWNGWADTIEAVYSLKKLHYSNYNIVVVDNASTDESVQKIQNEFPDITLLQMHKNKGYAGGNNAGIRYALDAGADYCWILNNDTVVDDHALFPLIKKMETRSDIGICGSLLLYYDDREQVQALGGGRYNKWLGVTRSMGDGWALGRDIDESAIAARLNFIAGASMLVSRPFVEKVGLMSEEYFLFYEELDWATRGKEEFSLGFAPDSIVYHKQGASINPGEKADQTKSRIGDYYQIKNRLMFSRKFYPYCLPTVYLSVIYALFKRLIQGKWSRAAMILKLLFVYNR